MTARVRFQLIPRQTLPIATLHLALLSWATARALDADFVLTVADRDDAAPWQKNSVDDLQWLGLDWDEGPDADGELRTTRQSERISRYEAVYQQLERNDAAGLALDANGAFSSSFTTMVDDFDFAISHVATDRRALDPDTSRLLDALGWEPPALLYLHSPLAPDGTPLNVLPNHPYSIDDLRDGGYLPSAVFHYLLQLSWPAAADFERIDRWLVRKRFTLDQLTTVPIRFEWAQLRDVNRRYLQTLSSAALTEAIRPFLEEAYGALPPASGWLERIIAVIKPGLATLEDAVDAAEWALGDDIGLNDTAQTVVATPLARSILTQLIAEVAAVVLLDPQTAATILSAIEARLAAGQGLVNTAVCSALTGRVDTAAPATIMGILGKQRTLNRLGAALQ